MRKITLAAGLFVLAGATFAQAGETAQFLKIGTGARAIGMGGAFTAVADDISAISWNPAGLSNLTRREAGLMHAELAAETRYDFLGYSQPLKRGTLGASAIRLSQGTLLGRDSAGRPTSDFGASDMAVSAAYAQKVSPALRFGGGVKYITSRIADASANTFAFDLGGLYELGLGGPGIPTIGFAVQNLGLGLKYLDQNSSLPLTLAGGLSYRLPAGLTLALDYKHRPYSSSEMSFGTEYALIPAVALRFGYGSAQRVSTGASRLSAMNGFSTGLGLKFQGYSLDYSLTPFGGLGNAQRFSLGARF